MSSEEFKCQPRSHFVAICVLFSSSERWSEQPRATDEELFSSAQQVGWCFPPPLSLSGSHTEPKEVPFGLSLPLSAFVGIITGGEGREEDTGLNYRGERPLMRCLRGAYESYILIEMNYGSFPLRYVEGIWEKR